LLGFVDSLEDQAEKKREDSAAILVRSSPLKSLALGNPLGYDGRIIVEPIRRLTVSEITDDPAIPLKAPNRELCQSI
jgi:hypothetical protein